MFARFFLFPLKTETCPALPDNFTAPFIQNDERGGEQISCNADYFFISGPK